MDIYGNLNDKRRNRGLLTAIIGLAVVLAAGGWIIRAGGAPKSGSADAYVRVETSAEADAEEKKIALTFDDGPSACTEELLDGLKERGVHATFFLLGCNLEGREDTVRRMRDEGHLIGNHTYSHVDIAALSDEEALKEIQSCSDAIYSITGEPIEYVRPPYGSRNKSLESAVDMIPVFWTVDSLDWQSRNADTIVSLVMSEAEENDIILMHDCYESTVEAALRLVDLLQADGYSFVTVDELILE